MIFQIKSYSIDLARVIFVEIHKEHYFFIIAFCCCKKTKTDPLSKLVIMLQQLSKQSCEEAFVEVFYAVSSNPTRHEFSVQPFGVDKTGTKHNISVWLRSLLSYYVVLGFKSTG